MPVRWGFSASADLSGLLGWYPDSGLAQHFLHRKYTRLCEALTLASCCPLCFGAWVFDPVLASCSSESQGLPPPLPCAVSVSKWPHDYMSTVCLLSSPKEPQSEGRVWFCVLCLVLEQSLGFRRCLGNRWNWTDSKYRPLKSHGFCLPSPPLLLEPVLRLPLLTTTSTVLRGPGLVAWSGIVPSLPANFHLEPPSTSPWFSCPRLFFLVLGGLLPVPPHSHPEGMVLLS